MQSRTRQWILAVAAAMLLASSGVAHAAALETDHRVDINTASAADLASLPGIGDAKAKAIIEYRSADPFRTVEDLKKVKGIGDKMFESLRPNLMVSEAPAKK